MSISLDEALGRARGAYDVQIAHALKDLAAILRGHGYNAAEIFRAVAEHREELLVQRDVDLANLREELLAWAYGEACPAPRLH